MSISRRSFLGLLASAPIAAPVAAKQLAASASIAGTMRGSAVLGLDIAAIRWAEWNPIRASSGYGRLIDDVNAATRSVDRFTARLDCASSFPRVAEKLVDRAVDGITAALDCGDAAKTSSDQAEIIAAPSVPEAS